MSLRLPRFLRSIPLVENNGTPTLAFHQWWDTTLKEIEKAVGDIQIALTASGVALDGVAAVNDEPFIRVTSSVDQTLPAGVLTILDYDSVETNNAPTVFSPASNGQVTVQEAGVYSISTGVVLQASAIDALSTADLGIFVNGDLIAISTTETTLGVSQSRGQSIATQISLEAGDVVDARVRASTVSGTGNGVARRAAVLLGTTATQVNHLSIVRCTR